MKDDPNNHIFGRKLSKLIATMRRLPEPPAKAQPQPAIANGMKYEQLIDGIGSTVKNKEKFRLACCDCGLVHDVAIVAPKARKGVELGFAVARNKRATSQRRRQMRLNA